MVKGQKHLKCSSWHLRPAVDYHTKSPPVCKFNEKHEIIYILKQILRRFIIGVWLKVSILFSSSSLVFLGILCLLGSAFGGYNMAMAAMSPCPLLQHTPLGDAIIVSSLLM